MAESDQERSDRDSERDAERDYDHEQRRRAALTPAQRAAEDARNQALWEADAPKRAAKEKRQLDRHISSLKLSIANQKAAWGRAGLPGSNPILARLEAELDALEAGASAKVEASQKLLNAPAVGGGAQPEWAQRADGSIVNNKTGRGYSYDTAPPEAFTAMGVTQAEAKKQAQARYNEARLFAPPSEKDSYGLIGQQPGSVGGNGKTITGGEVYTPPGAAPLPFAPRGGQVGTAAPPVAANPWETPRLRMPGYIDPNAGASSMFGSWTGTNNGGGAAPPAYQAPRFDVFGRPVGQTRFSLMSAGPNPAGAVAPPAIEVDADGNPVPGTQSPGGGPQGPGAAPPAGDGGQVDARGKPKPPAGPGYDYRLSYNSDGYPIWQVYNVSERAGDAGGSREGPSAGRNAAVNEGELANDTALLPYKIDEIMAGIGLTTDQAARIRALLPGEIMTQTANIDRIYAEIQNAAARLGLDTSRLNWDKERDTATLLGQVGDRPTLAREQLYGFDPQGNPTLEARRHQLDIAQTRGYLPGGEATLDREKQVTDSERSNLLALAQTGNLAAQVRLREIDQAEIARQYDTTTEMQWRQNPSSLADRAFNQRGAQARIAAPAGQGNDGYTPSGKGMVDERLVRDLLQAPPPRSGALSYQELEQSGGIPPAIAAMNRGGGGGDYASASGAPRASNQGLNRLSPSNRSIYDAQSRQMGDDPADLAFQRKKLMGNARPSSITAPRAVGY